MCVHSQKRRYAIFDIAAQIGFILILNLKLIARSYIGNITGNFLHYLTGIIYKYISIGLTGGLGFDYKE